MFYFRCSMMQMLDVNGHQSKLIGTWFKHSYMFPVILQSASGPLLSSYQAKNFFSTLSFILFYLPLQDSFKTLPHLDSRVIFLPNSQNNSRAHSSAFRSLKIKHDHVNDQTPSRTRLFLFIKYIKIT